MSDFLSSSSPKRIALATCSNLPDWEVDDQPLFKALESHGIQLFHPSWDDPHFDWSQCDLVIPRTTWDYQSKADQFSQWLTYVHQHSMLLNSLSLMKWNLNKSYLKDLEIAQPPTLWIKQSTPSSSERPPLLSALLKKDQWERGFIKPVIGANSWGTLRFNRNDEDSLQQAQIHLEQWVKTHDLMIQPYYSSVETDGEFSLIFFNGQWSHGVQKVPVSGDYRVQDDYGAQDYPWTPPQSWLKQAQDLLKSLPETPLYARCDFLKDHDNLPRLIELELIEPSLFFRHDPASPERFAKAILERLI